MNLDELRNEIDRIDAKFVRLLNERACNAVRIGEQKKKEGSPVHDPAREEEVLARVRKLNKGPLSDEAIEEIYRRIVSACLDVQSRKGGGMGSGVKI